MRPEVATVQAMSMEKLKLLRQRTEASLADCRQALEASGGDLERAVQWLRHRGSHIASKKAERTAREGLIGTYLHHGGRIGVLVEVNCETDFVARNEAFQQFVRDLAMQIAAANPRVVARADLPASVIHEVGDADQAAKQCCLLEQAFIKDPSRTIQDYLNELTAKIGERIVIRRFVRYELGGEARQ